ncbi:hypothetical protein BOX15_Mlig026882g2 [Macrostomum lignano]|uniref:Uncharacterized protein n=2 Tax=Macrostomum lignano TaxID=282301 RepID=A0A267FVI6_9PLAT|nr:hypothetical protein BOX15_Mlig026882g2 [Macrostomum lignano]
MFMEATGGLAQQARRWEEVRRRARQLENSLDQKLVSLSKLGASSGRGGGGGSETGGHMLASMSAEVERLLSELSSCHSAMTECVESGAGSLHTLQRHRDILTDYQKEFQRTRHNIEAAREREELLGSVRTDINAFRAQGRTGLILSENESLKSSERLADQQIDLAMSVKENLLGQNRVVRGVQNRLNAVATRFPTMNSLIHKINLRKRRDAIVVAGVTALCLVLLIVYVFR